MWREDVNDDVDLVEKRRNEFHIFFFVLKRFLFFFAFVNFLKQNSVNISKCTQSKIKKSVHFN